MSDDNDTVESVNWTIGENDEETLTFYVGLSKMVIDRDNSIIGEYPVPEYIEWGSDDCHSEYCSDCEDAASSVISSVIITFITSK